MSLMVSPISLWRASAAFLPRIISRVADSPLPSVILKCRMDLSEG